MTISEILTFAEEGIATEELTDTAITRAINVINIAARTGKLNNADTSR